MHNTSQVTNCRPQPIAMFGGCVMVCGDAVRKIAMITAADNFDHIVQTDKAEKHKVR